MSRKGAVESIQVVTDRAGREVVDDVAFAARRRSLHELAVPTEKDAVQGPGTLWRSPVERTSSRDAGCEIDDRAGLRVRDQRNEGKRLRKADLLERERLQVRVGSEWLNQITDLQL